jgi:hypothetical protein
VVPWPPFLFLNPVHSWILGKGFSSGMYGLFGIAVYTYAENASKPTFGEQRRLLRIPNLEFHNECGRVLGEFYVHTVNIQFNRF